jgi:lipid-binding SYLF domain-containing protein
MLFFAVRTALVAALLAAALTPALALARGEEETIRASHEVLHQFLDLQIREIPDSLLAEAHGVAIIPDVIKLGFVVGGQRGHGVVIIRERDGSWRAPIFVTITGGSVGWQIGAQSTDFVLVFKSQKSVDGLLRGKFTLGADAAVAAGPVGRRAGAATDMELKAEIYTYSRSRGLFAGVSLEGSALQVDDAANAAYYGPTFPGAPPPAVPASALRLVEIVARLTNHATAAPPASASSAIPAQPGTIAPATSVLAPKTGRHLDELQGRLAQGAMQLSPLLDDAWRQYLALPAEVYQPGRRPTPEAVEAALNRYRAVAQDRQYRALADRAEFHTTHQLLQAFYEDLRASSQPLHGLAPPPATWP